MLSLLPGSGGTVSFMFFWLSGYTLSENYRAVFTINSQFKEAINMGEITARYFQEDVKCAHHWIAQ